MTKKKNATAGAVDLQRLVRPWYLISPTCLTWWDKLRLLLGWKLYIRFDAPNGQCSAACDHSWAVSRAKYADEKLPWRWGNNWQRPNAGGQRRRAADSESKTSELPPFAGLNGWTMNLQIETLTRIDGARMDIIRDIEKVRRIVVITERFAASVRDFPCGHKPNGVGGKCDACEALKEWDALSSNAPHERRREQPKENDGK